MMFGGIIDRFSKNEAEFGVIIKNLIHVHHKIFSAFFKHDYNYYFKRNNFTVRNKPI